MKMHDHVRPAGAGRGPVISAATYSDDLVDVPPSPDEVEHIEESLHDGRRPRRAGGR